MQKFSVKCLGVGDGAPSADRNHSAYLYDFGGVRLLIDCGEPLSRSFQVGKEPFGVVDRVLISHYHFDHIGGFFMFIQGSWLEGRKRALPVHLPSGGIQAVQGMLHAACLFDKVLPFPIHFEPLRAGDPIQLPGLRITPFLTTHLDHFRELCGEEHPGHYEAFGFVLESENRRVCHTADLGSPTDLDEVLQSRLDVLLCELSHFEPEKMFAYLKGAEVKRIIFTHLGRPYWECLPEVQATARRMLPGRDLVFARDLETIPL